MNQLAARTELFGTCITRQSSLRTAAVGGINLAQGFPEANPASSVVKASVEATLNGRNQYADMRGLAELREAVPQHRCEWVGGSYSSESEVTITCGATEAMIASLLATIDPGDEVLLQAPSYENYRPQVILAGGIPRFFRLSGSGNRLDVAAIDSMCSSRTKAVILNNPNNPTGRVFGREELEGLADLCCRRDLYLLLDEVYEHLVWDRRTFISAAGLPGMRERTVVISSLSKTWAATGWRVGWALAPSDITAGIRRCHDFLTGCAPTAAQIGAVQAMSLNREYYDLQTADYESRRTLLGECLRECGLDVRSPEGTYYFFADVRPLGYEDSSAFAAELLQQAGVGVVPWQAFFEDDRPENRVWARLNFAKARSTLEQAADRLLAFARTRARG